MPSETHLAPVHPFRWLTSFPDGGCETGLAITDPQTASKPVILPEAEVVQEPPTKIPRPPCHSFHIAFQATLVLRQVLLLKSFLRLPSLSTMKCRTPCQKPFCHCPLQLQARPQKIHGLMKMMRMMMMTIGKAYSHMIQIISGSMIASAKCRPYGLQTKRTRSLQIVVVLPKMNQIQPQPPLVKQAVYLCFQLYVFGLQPLWLLPRTRRTP